MFYNEQVYLQSIDLVDRHRNEERLALGKVAGGGGGTNQ